MTNCPNCGAPAQGDICRFCDTPLLGVELKPRELEALSMDMSTYNSPLSNKRITGKMNTFTELVDCEIIGKMNTVQRAVRCVIRKKMNTIVRAEDCVITGKMNTIVRTVDTSRSK